VTIGIEVHCQLLTKSKIFSPSQNKANEAPNSHIDETCLALPGALPVLNEACLDLGLRMALALNCEIQEYSSFSRKNYYYPDLPKGYQITQYDKPFCLEGYLPLESGRNIKIERIQLEEDAAKNIHVGSSTLIDYNRAGIGLIEIVSHPDIHSPEEASEYLKKLHSYCVNLEISEGSMEKGHFRADANVSIKPKGQKELGTRCEVKNINSFKYLEKAIAHEIQRHYKIIESGKEIHYETRGYNSEKGETYSLRAKASAQDYRFFPEPDLPDLFISKERIERVKKTLPELPESKEKRFVEDYKLPSYDAKIIASNKIYSKYFESLVRKLKESVSTKTISNFFMTDILRALKVYSESKGISLDDIHEIPYSLDYSYQLLDLVSKGTISNRTAKEVFEETLESSKSPLEIIQERSLTQVSDEVEIRKICLTVIENNPSQLSDYFNGRERLFGFFIGQAMKASNGKLNPKNLNKIMKEEIDKRKSK
jgi:aspartyl-tRNA(Asn)/glutamyl-tRNA(Gln) amidotransferase subunit B